jgi:hypothetical protein
LKNVPFKLDEYIFDKELQHTDDFICVALYFFSAGCFVIEISVKKMKKTPKKPYETKSGEVYKRDGFEGNILQQIIGTPMGINCAPLLANLFLFSYRHIK